MQASKTIETWVGLFVAMGLVALFFVAMQVSNLAELQTNEASYKITARFENIGSLKVRAPVSVAGVKIGRVSHIGFDNKTFEAIVEMRIEPQFNTLPVDTSASILTAGLLGEQYIGLSPGGFDDTLKDGDELELTQSAIVLEQVISRFLFNKAESGSGNNNSGGSDDDSADSGSAAPAVNPAPRADTGAAPAPEDAPGPAESTGTAPPNTTTPHQPTRPKGIPPRPKAKKPIPRPKATPAKPQAKAPTHEPHGATGWVRVGPNRRGPRLPWGVDLRHSHPSPQANRRAV
ncbi:outer membrane lipid asymmetry maintenance protein MlaD [Methylomagnum ishizawai]|uniref:Outer membrane lipid asymmetry maintenance protein MlaD n=1 Tax=Methylomagnum ishizawai TaxID=1760988 RepID=A0A1Y6CWX4_9GAMM|nr:outer membrane lipid asymmetry maintenance protein MlaD [Methylomagnum ishizawai]